ncbi:MAG: putative nucleotidyltransferase substrate binding domain-containing protein, partial [Gaiellaceae bacterium]
NVPAETIVLVEDGPPSTAFWVTRAGSMELVHEEAVIDILEPGEGFGHPSLLSGLAPSFTVRAHEDSVCYLIPRGEALRVFGRPEGAGFVARSLRERLVRAGHTVHGLPELATVHIGELVPGPPVYCEPGVAITRAAEIMTRSGSSAVLIRSGELQIVTDADIRAKAVGGPISPQNPVLRIAEPAVVVEPQRLAVDAIVEMLDHDVDHIVVADGGEVLGIVSASDLMGLQTRSPFALRHSILHARDEDELLAVSRRLGGLFLALLHAGVSPADVGRVLTLQYDALTTRLLDFAIERHGPAPAPWAWLALGSSARRELTLGSDQENALAYAETGDRGVDAVFESIAADVCAGLVLCGFVADANGVLASTKLWRMSLPAWEKTIGSCFTSPDRSHLIRATVALDFRQLAGGLEVVEPLVAILRDGHRYPDFIRRLARTATDFKPPLGFRGAFATARSKGAPPGTVDVKRGGMLPIVNLARFHALANEVTISATLDRLVAVEELGRLPSEEATALREAFVCVWRVRLEHHAARIALGSSSGEVDNHVDPSALPPLEREELREAFRAIVRAQKRLDVYVPSGI